MMAMATVVAVDRTRVFVLVEVATRVFVPVYQLVLMTGMAALVDLVARMMTR
jgi:hypothetical protein